MVTGEVLLFDQKEAPKVVMLDECIEANFEKQQEENLREEMESEEEDESEGSQEFNNDKVIEEILDLINPDQDDETQDGTIKVNFIQFLRIALFAPGNWFISGNF